MNCSYNVFCGTEVLYVQVLLNMFFAQRQGRVASGEALARSRRAPLALSQSSCGFDLIFFSLTISFLKPDKRNSCPVLHKKKNFHSYNFWYYLWSFKLLDNLKRGLGVNVLYHNPLHPIKMIPDSDMLFPYS